MEILQLRYFLESAKNQNFTKTAEMFLVPTTSVSASIKRLEEELGVQLFDRSANKIVLNSNGEHLMKAVSNLFFELDSAVNDLSANDKNQEIKLLVKAVRSNVTDYIVEYSKKNPKAVFKTVFDFLETNYEKYDIVIDEKNNLYKGYSNFELLCLSLKLKTNKDNFVNKKFKLIDFKNCDFISWGENSNMHKILVDACETAGFSPNIVVSINDKECYEKLVKSGIGIGISGAEIDNLSEIKDISVIDFNKNYVVNCYYNPLKNYGSVKKFIEFLKEKATNKLS